MTEQRNNDNLEQKIKEGVYIRTIRSFVKREGRLTKGQQNALDQHWDLMGLDHENGLIDFNQIFGNDNPVIAEIGFGMGKSLVEMAKAAPETNFIGIEVHTPGVGACLAYAAELEVTNLRVYCHDAIAVLADCIPKDSLSCISLILGIRRVITNAGSCKVNFPKTFVAVLSLRGYSIWPPTGRIMQNIWLR